MNITTLIHNIRDAIHDNAATQAWCTTHYGRHHKVYVGVDARNPPGEDQYPLVHLIPLQKTFGDGDQRHVIGVTCGLHDDDLLTTTKTNVVEMAALGNLETFRKYVESAICTVALDAGHDISIIDVNYEPIAYFPYCLCAMEISILATLSFGDDYCQ